MVICSMISLPPTRARQAVFVFTLHPSPQVNQCQHVVGEDKPFSG